MATGAHARYREAEGINFSMKRKRKIKGNDLVIEEDLNVVRSAGFRQHKRRKLKMNENRRAGLNYKKTKKTAEIAAQTVNRYRFSNGLYP